MAVNATAVWRVRPSGNNANGGGYDTGISSPGTDYSQQNAAQITFNGSTITATTSGVSATITITGYTVAITDIANALHITGGTNFTAGWYFIQSVNTGSNTWTLDRNVATGAGSGMTGNMGGGWADFWTNTTSSGPLVAGNIVYILGTGISSPSTSTFDYSAPSFFTSAQGNYTAGKIKYLNDSATPATGVSKPVVVTSGLLFYNNTTQIMIDGLYFICNSSSNINNGIINTATLVSNCVFDMNGYKGCAIYMANAIANEIFTSVTTSRGDGSFNAINANLNYSFTVERNFIHNLTSTAAAIALAYGDKCVGNIVANNDGDGISLAAPWSSDGMSIMVNSNTIDSNTGNGISIANTTMVALCSIEGNLITNHTGVGKAALSVLSGTAAINDAAKGIIDYNSFYNNTANYSGISAGAHDVALGSSPYVTQSTENYALA